MIMSQEQWILKGQGQWAQIARFVRQAARDGRPIEEVERGLWQTLLKLGYTLLGAYVQGVGPGNVGDTLTYEGRTLRPGRSWWRRT
ncbi:MAG TPA: hypothetical protein PKY77_24635 [Phycisphaerae bacterium]|nr:hypothetical protein [Phycisphaerae bacterium]HRY71153.1 hypothetical protein [Phycisphaerae bacterium]HSA30115.1 hypothetical protein [Phycisphaerae bacterium]